MQHDIAEPVALHQEATLASHSAVAWLRNAAWPLWLQYGIDWPRRGFNESIVLSSLASPAGFRRLRVVARQVYVFAQAHRLGLPDAAAAVELGVEFLRDRARGGDGGYAQRFSLDGTTIDETRDLYDHAFVLLALSSASGVLPKDRLRQEALALLNYLDTHFTHPSGGYLESLPPALPRRQNPHMHLLEALLAAADAFGEDIFLKRADAVVRLFLDRLLDRRHGALPEFFDDALRPSLSEGGFAVEPGHHCEWAWLLHWYARSSPAARPVTAEIAEACTGLMRFVDRFGINHRLETVYNEIWQDGAIRDAGSRLWPQTERLKAEVLRPGAKPEAILASYRGLNRYLVAAPSGLWLERLNADGTAPEEPAPASSLYHLTCGILVADSAL